MPYAPTVDFEYKRLTQKLKEKASKSLHVALHQNFKEGKIFLQDTTKIWPQEITDLDAIITSPPFFDSTRFYLANWIRIWFAVWGADDFKYQTRSYIEEIVIVGTIALIIIAFPTIEASLSRSCNCNPTINCKILSVIKKGTPMRKASINPLQQIHQ